MASGREGLSICSARQWSTSASSALGKFLTARGVNNIKSDVMYRVGLRLAD